MTNSAENREESENTAFTRQIEVRLAEPSPRVRYENGQAIKEPTPDMGRVIRAIEEEITELVQAKYGGETEVLLSVGKAADVRLTGAFQEKATVTRKVVGEILAGVFENLEIPEE